ncbi:MAG TPA: radical SAM protein [Frankiaceae bacterium]|nr:radical SAM protein [Frankiaceae bacterium]
MDRVSGRWVTLAAATKPLLPLLSAPAGALPDGVRTQVRELRDLLSANGIGVLGSERHFSELTTLILKLTNACNYACTYCYDFETWERASRMTPEVAVGAVREALDLSGPILTVILHGGEPMLMWDLVEDLVVAGERLAAERGKRLQFVGQTNLSRLDDRVVAFSDAHDMAWGVSIDGVPEVHDALRVTHQGTGTYDRFADALRRYPRFARRCGVMSTITAVNQGRLLETARHFRDLGMGSWDWSLFQPIGRGRVEAQRLRLDIPTLVASWDALFEAVVAGEFDGFKVNPVTKYLDNLASGPGGNMCMRPECGAARDLLSVSVDGVIEACDCIDPAGPLSGLGTMADGGLAAARDSEVARSIRHRDLQSTRCADCIWYGACGGSCLAHAPSLDDVWDEGCALALRAFDRITDSLAHDDALARYQRSLS